LNKLFIIPIEPIETRYTKHWHSYLPAMFKDNLKNTEVIQIEGIDIPPVTTPGAFLDFSATNMYKAKQVERLAKLFSQGEVKNGDHFIFADAWHPGIINLKYMADLLNINIITHGLHHAGSYDPQDFLGRLIGNEDGWCRYAELSMFEAYTHNWYATDYHIDLVARTQLRHVSDDKIDEMKLSNKICQTGWPMEYMLNQFKEYKHIEKQDIILFPHRLAPEKQHDIFLDLAKEMPEYEFITCQDKKLTKHQYHVLLAQSKMIFSANLQETLGIGVPEGMAVNAIPCVPDRLSYSEMYSEHFKYPSEWTDSFEDYLSNKDKLVAYIKLQIESYDKIRPMLADEFETIYSNFFCATNLIETINNGK
jgi:hypothetical protein